MRYHEIASGFRIPISGEEQDVLDNITKSAGKDELGEREKEVARLMVSRGLLTRVRDKDGKINFEISTVKDIWRDR